MLYTDEQMEDGDDGYEVSTTRTRDSENRDRVETSSSSTRTAEGITISVVRGSITDQKVLYSRRTVRMGI